jgi:hypothetical protein
MSAESPLKRATAILIIVGAGRAPLAIVSAVVMSDRIEFGSMQVGFPELSIGP